LFALENFLLVGTLGYSVGHRIFGIEVRRLDGHVPGLLKSLIRALLVVLVIPAVIFDRDNRGLHDLAAGTVILRRCQASSRVRSLTSLHGFGAPAAISAHFPALGRRAPRHAHPPAAARLSVALRCSVADGEPCFLAPATEPAANDRAQPPTAVPASGRQRPGPCERAPTRMESTPFRRLLFAAEAVDQRPRMALWFGRALFGSMPFGIGGRVL